MLSEGSYPTDINVRREEQVRDLQAGGGIGAAVGFMALAIGVPFLAKGMARKGITKLAQGFGRRTTPAAGALAKGIKTAGADEAALSAFLNKQSFGARMQGAAHVTTRGATEAPDISKFLSLSGISKGPMQMRERGTAWRTFKSDPARKKMGTAKALFDPAMLKKHGGQAKLMKSFANHWGKENLAFLPMAYVTDTSLGLTHEPGEAPAAWNVPAHVTNFVKWLPTYAAYDLGFRGLGAAMGMAKPGIQSMGRAIGEQRQLAKGLSHGFETIRQTRNAARDISVPIRNTYTRRVANAKNPLRNALDKASTSVIGRLRDRSAAMRVDKNKYNIEGSGTLKSVKNLFRPKSFVDSILPRTAKADNNEALFDRIHALAIGGGQASKSMFGRLFQGKDVTVGEMMPHVDKESQAFFRELQDTVNQSLTTLAKNPKATKEQLAFAQQFANVDNLKVSGFIRVGDDILRAPTGRELLSAGGRAVNRLTTMYIPGQKRKGGLSIAQIFNTHTVTEARTPIRVVQGGMDINGGLAYFGRIGGTGMRPKGLPSKGKYFAAGLQIDDGMMMDTYGMTSNNIFGKLNRSSTIGLSGFGAANIQKLQIRQHLKPPEEKDFVEAQGTGMLPKMQNLWRSLKQDAQVSSHSAEGYQMLKSLFNTKGPRRMFAPKSTLWKSLKTMDMDPLDEMVPDALRQLKHALGDSSDVYTRREVFSSAVRGAFGGKGSTLKGAKTQAEIMDILDNDKSALRFAKEVMEKAQQGLREGDAARIAPSTNRVKEILRRVDQDPNQLYNAHHNYYGQTLRQYIFESALGAQQGAAAGDAAQASIRRMVSSGSLSKGAGAQAEAGLVYMHARRRIGALKAGELGDIGTDYGMQFIHRPFDVELPKARRQMIYSEMGNVLDDYRGTMERFAGSRPRIDAAYRHRAFDTEESIPFQLADVFGVNASVKDVGKLFVGAGIDTSRKALSFIGLGWHPSKSVAQTGGRKALTRLWMGRAKTAGTIAVGYGALDTAVDLMNLPEETGLQDGITPAVAGIAANARLAASKVYDTLGISGAASYMEGLMPKSASTLPGAALGFYAAGWKGALVGAALNRMTSETMRDTPFEALSILPIFAPFVSDMTESYEQTRAKYTGQEMVPVRKGRYFMLSSTDYTGSRVEQYRPNWYWRSQRDVSSTPTLYGSDLEKLIFKPLPFVDFAVGDLIDPHYVQKKQYFDRPYVEPRVPFSGMPLVGPLVGNTLGRMFVKMHPLASMKPMHMEDTVGEMNPEGFTANQFVGPSQISGQYGQGIVGSPIGGYDVAGYSAGSYQDESMGPAFVSSGTIVGANTSRAVYDEQFYRLTEAMGFTGFVTQQLAGGEGLFRDAIMPSASEMTSTARNYHDLGMGDMLGVGEAMRRLYPFVRDADRLGPRNTQASWMPEEYQYGDPYCLTPDTLIEINEELIPAEEAFQRHQEGAELLARTHKGRLRPIIATAVRDVDEEVYRFEVAGLPWPLTVTGEHPLLVLDRTRRRPVWKLARDVAEGESLLAPVGPEYTGIETRHHESGRPLTPMYTLPHDGVVAEGLMALTKVEPPATRKYLIHGMSEEDTYWLNTAFHLEGSKYYQREKSTVAWLRQHMAEYGLPHTMVGMQAGALRPIVKKWGRVHDTGIDITLTTDLLGLQHNPEWTGRTPYEPEATPRQALERAAWTFQRALAAARTPANLVFYDDRVVLELQGRNAAPYIYTHEARSGKKRQGRHLSGLDCLEPLYIEKPISMGGHYIAHPVVKREEVAYSGPVYAFEVEGDSSFVAAGVATHNSKIAYGEALLPGDGFEVMGLQEGDRELSVSDLAATAEQTAMNILGYGNRRDSKQASWAKKQVVEQMLNTGIAQRDETVFVDERSRLVAVATAATVGRKPIMVEALDDIDFQQTYGPRAIDQEKANAALGAAKRAQASIVYVNTQTGETQSYIQKFDSGLYNKSLQKLQAADLIARDAAAAGYGARGATYSTLDRMQVLLNAAPFSDEWRVEQRKAKAFENTGTYAPAESMRFHKLMEMHRKMAMPFEIYNQRFGYDQLLNPDQSYENLTYNDNVQAAANYSLPERMMGSVWETWSGLRTPLHSKFFGAYNVEESYTNRVLLSRDFQSWNQPIDDFVKPYMRGLLAAEDPLQGALSYGVGGAVFGGPMFGFLGASLGTVYGAVHGGYRKMTGTNYIPQEIQDVREVEQQFDRIKYYRSKRLYDATKDQRYLNEMQRSSYGWTQDGLSGTGWAKERRRMFAPSNRLDSQLFATDGGFGSGITKYFRKIKKAGDAVLRHSQKNIQQIGKGLQHRVLQGKQWMRETARNVGKALVAPQPAMRSGPGLVMSTRMPRTIQQATPISGFAEQGMAASARSTQTAMRGNLGFGSPWQGQVAAYDVMYNPYVDPIPTEMYTAFASAPTMEKDYMRAGLLIQDPERRERFQRLVSPDMASMLDMGANYLYGDPLDQARQMDPYIGMNMGFSEHAVMGAGAYVDGYQIKTMEALGLDPHDAGLGWKRTMLRMNTAVVQPTTVASAMGEGTDKRTGDPDELIAILKRALAQMGIMAEVTSNTVRGPSELHLVQAL